MGDAIEVPSDDEVEMLRRRAEQKERRLEKGRQRAKEAEDQQKLDKKETIGTEATDEATGTYTRA